MILFEGCENAIKRENHLVKLEAKEFTPLNRSDSINIGTICFNSKGFVISKKYNEAPFIKVKSSLAVILDIRKATNKSEWCRILCADGSWGWIESIEGKFSTSELKRITYPLYSQSPDDSNFVFSSVPLYESDEDKTGRIIGASESSFEESLWLKVKTDSMLGWTPSYEADLNWNEFFDSIQNCNLCAIDRYGLSGFIKKPFLGPIQGILNKVKPSVHSAVYYANNDLDKIQNVSWASSKPFGGPIYLIRDVDDNKDAISTMIMHWVPPPDSLIENINRKAFTFITESGAYKYLLYDDSDSYGVEGYQKIDLDNDSFNEWLVELNFKYPDGYYSTLMLVDGQSMKSSFAIHKLDLGGACFEPGCETNVNSYWWVDKTNDNTGRVFRVFSYQDTVATEFALFRYSPNSGLKQVAKKNLYAVLLAESNDKLQAEKLNVSISKKLNYDNLHVFPRNEKSLIKWSVGRIFEEQKDALLWMQSLKSYSKSVKLLELSQHFP
jgi:hypothetical protein